MLKVETTNTYLCRPNIPKSVPMSCDFTTDKANLVRCSNKEDCPFKVSAAVIVRYSTPELNGIVVREGKTTPEFKLNKHPEINIPSMDDFNF